jgi:hypothetical protein
MPRLDGILIDIPNIFIDVLDFLINGLVDVLDDVLSLELQSQIEYSYSPNDFYVLTPHMLHVTILILVPVRIL